MDPVARVHVRDAVLTADGHRHDEDALGVPKHVVNARIQTEPGGRVVELRERGTPGTGCHVGSSCESGGRSAV